MSLTSLALMLHAGGRPDLALVAADEAVAIFRKLAAAQTSAFVNHLAGALSIQSTARADRGDATGALHFIS